MAQFKVKDHIAYIDIFDSNNLIPGLILEVLPRDEGEGQTYLIFSKSGCTAQLVREQRITSYQDIIKTFMNYDKEHMEKYFDQMGPLYKRQYHEFEEKRWT